MLVCKTSRVNAYPSAVAWPQERAVRDSCMWCTRRLYSARQHQHAHPSPVALLANAHPFLYPYSAANISAMCDDSLDLDAERAASLLLLTPAVAPRATNPCIHVGKGWRGLVVFA